MRVYIWDRYRVGKIILLFLAGLAGAFICGRCWYAVRPAGAPVYSGDPGTPYVALTVNVFWGEEYLPAMLDIMQKYNVRATFFLGGSWVKKFPELAGNIARAGHEVGNHSYSHPYPDRLSREANQREIQRAEEEIYRATGVRTRLYAPPYGERGKAVLDAARELGYTTILWSVDTIDWQRPSPQVITRRVLDKVHNGAIILMHPTAPTVQALPGMISGLRARGYLPVTVSQLLQHRPGGERDDENR
ncbi:MAG: polysaccharide deacetylase family protein [Desulfurispora sp.]|uniref:polysaccharide deacetylase family protein n=1 Tax=Desulfurispora sp. TaxID=3014275 RepID=UPI004049FF07